MNDLFIILFFLFAFALGILLIRFIILKLKGKKIANKISFILGVLTLCLFIGIIINDRFNRTHNLEFQYSKNIKITIYALEHNTFLDWPVEFEIKILNSKNEIIENIEFTTAEGPYIKFYPDSLNVNSMVIESYEPEFGIRKEINLKSSNKPTYKSVNITGQFLLQKQR